MSTTSKIEKPDWWSQKLSADDKANVQKALVDYIIEEELTRSEITDNVDFSKKVLS